MNNFFDGGGCYPVTCAAAYALSGLGASTENGASAIRAAHLRAKPAPKPRPAPKARPAPRPRPVRPAPTPRPRTWVPGPAPAPAPTPIVPSPAPQPPLFADPAPAPATVYPAPTGELLDDSVYYGDSSASLPQPAGTGLDTGAIAERAMEILGTSGGDDLGVGADGAQQTAVAPDSAPIGPVQAAETPTPAAAAALVPAAPAPAAGGAGGTVLAIAAAAGLLFLGSR